MSTLVALLFLLSPLAGQDPEIVVRGRALDSSRTPLEGVGCLYGPAEVLITDRVLSQPDMTTDADGRFEMTLEMRRAFAGVDGGLMLAKAGHEAKVIDPSFGSTAGWPPEHGVVDFGDVVLAEGFTLHGRVRDENGDPLEGVEIVAVDMLREEHFFESGRPETVGRSATRSGPEGIFSLRCVPHSGLSVEFQKPGYYLKRIAPVSRSTPLDVRLEESGFVEGRVEFSRKLERGEYASLHLDYEVAAGFHAEPVEEDGSFRFGLKYPGRYRLRAVATLQAHMFSELLEGPRSGLVLGTPIPVPKPQPLREEDEGFTVRAVDSDGAPVPDFRAVVRWRDAGFLRAWMHENFEFFAEHARDGVLIVRPDSPDEGPLATILIKSDGYAPKTATRSADDREITVTLDPESIVTGRVVDGDTGQPLQGAEVWAQISGADPGFMTATIRPPTVTVHTGADGRFRIDGLGGERHLLYARIVGRRDPEPVPVQLKPGEVTEGIEVKVPVGLRLRGKVTGIPEFPAWHVDLRQIGGFMAPRINSSSVPEVRRVSVSPEGEFEVTSLTPGTYLPSLVFSEHHRSGPDIAFNLEPLRLGRDLETELDVSALRPGKLRGQLKFSRVPVPPERLVVELIAAGARMGLMPWLESRRSTVSPELGFEVRAAPGTYQVIVRDFATNLVLRPPEPVELEAGGSVTRDLEVDAAELTVKLQSAEAEGRALVAVLEVGMPDDPAPDSWETLNGYVPLIGSEEDVVLYAPRGELFLQVSDDSVSLELEPRWAPEDNVRGRERVTIGAEQRREVVLEVKPRREIKQ